MENSLKELKNACDKHGFNKLYKDVELLCNLAVLNNGQALLSDAQQNEYEVVFSQNIITLYEIIPDIALDFVSSFITELFKRRISSRVPKKDDNSTLRSELESWENVVRVIVSGIEKYAESHTDRHSQLGEILYKPLFRILCSLAGRSCSIRLRIQMFAFLSDLARTSDSNRELLRERDVLGGPRLGALISSTNEYLVLVILLQLLESMLTESEDIPGDVFQNLRAKRPLKQASGELVKIVQSAESTEWDLVADRLIRAMAVTDPKKPRPFELASPRIKANGKTFFHPKTLQYIYMDNTAFIINFEDEDGIDCLDIAYKTIVSMSFKDYPASSRVEISLNLSSPPMMSTNVVPSKTKDNAVSFEIHLADLQKFKDAVKYRGLNKLVRKFNAHLQSKQSVACEPLDLSLSNVSLLSLESKSFEVEEFYRTSTPDPVVSAKRKICETKHPEIDLTTFIGNNASVSSHLTGLGDLVYDECPKPSSKQSQVQSAAAKPVQSVVPIVDASYYDVLENELSELKDMKIEQAARPVPQATGKITTLKRKRSDTMSEADESERNSKEMHRYDSQFLTAKAPVSTKKYKARRRVVNSSAESESGSEDDIAKTLLPSPTILVDHMDIPKPLMKLNTDRPNRLILPASTKKVENKVVLVPKSVSAKKPVAGKPKPRPLPKKKIVDSENLDSNAKRPVPFKITREKSTFAKPTIPVPKTSSPQIAVQARAEREPDVPKSLTLTLTPKPKTVVDKDKSDADVPLPAKSVQFVIEASSPFRGKQGFEPGFFDDHDHDHDGTMSLQQMEMDACDKFAQSIIQSDHENDDADKSILSLRAGCLDDLKENVSLTRSVTMTPAHGVRLSQTKISQTQTKAEALPLPLLNSALKTAPRSVPSVIDLTRLTESPEEKENLTECDYVPSAKKEVEVRSKYYRDAVDTHSTNATDEKSILNTATKAVNTSKVTFQLSPLVDSPPFEEQRSRDYATDNLDRVTFSKLKTNRNDKQSFVKLHSTSYRNTFKRRTPHSRRRILKYVSEDSESHSDLSQDEGDSVQSEEQKLVNVLNKIHETIIENLGRKVKQTSAHSNAISKQFRLYAAEELNKMLQRSVENRQNLIDIKESYADYGKQLRGALEEVRKSTLDIHNTMGQAVRDHDAFSLVRKMPLKLAPHPKFL